MAHTQSEMKNGSSKAWPTNKVNVNPKINGYDDNDGVFLSKLDIFRDFTEITRIPALIYIFFNYQSKLGRIFWSIVFLLLVLLGIYWTLMSYVDWKTSPVTTKVATTTAPIANVLFPAVTFCSHGMNEGLVMTTIVNMFLDFHNKKYGQSANITLLEAEALLKKQENGQMLPKETEVIGEFFNSTFHGLSLETKLNDLVFLVKLLASKDPDGLLDLMMANEMVQPPRCGPSVPGKRQVSACDPGYIEDSRNGYCYMATVNNGPNLWDNPASDQQLKNYNPLGFDSDDQIQEFLSLYTTGSFDLSMESNHTFFFNVKYQSDGIYKFFNKDVNIKYFEYVSMTNPGGPDLPCIISTLGPKSSKIVVTPVKCSENRSDVFFTMYRPKTICVETDPLDFYFDPSFKADLEAHEDAFKDVFKNLFRNLTSTKAFEVLLPMLWNARLPCFNTGGSSPDIAVLKYCEWKGIEIPCRSIFVSSPTTQGMCCSFNTRTAEEIFTSQTYSKAISKFQNLETNVSMLPESYILKGEPVVAAGRKNGLFVMLDAHNDRVSAGSTDSDFFGFTAVITASGDVPDVANVGFEVIPGHNNIISLSGSCSMSDDVIRDIAIADRNCRFSDEMEYSRLFQNYSQTNCLYECKIFSALQKMIDINQTCIPWFVPKTDAGSTPMCDPWQSKLFSNYFDSTQEYDCNHCLPDCSSFSYQKSVRNVPFRGCDAANTGISRMCNLMNQKLPEPRQFANQVLEVMSQRFENIPPYMKKSVKSSMRRIESVDMLNNNPAMMYDAYEKDIATVEIYFESNTIMTFVVSSSNTWIGFLIDIGTLWGCTIAIWIFSFIEIFWLIMRLIAHALDFSERIP